MKKITDKMVAYEKGDTENINTGVLQNVKNKPKISGDNNNQSTIHQQINNFYDQSDPFNSYIKLLTEFNQYKINIEREKNEIENKIKRKYEKEIENLKSEFQEYKYSTDVLEFEVDNYENLNLIISKLNKLKVYVWHKTNSIFDNPETTMMFGHLQSSRKIKVFICIFKKDPIKFSNSIEIINDYSKTKSQGK